MNTTVDYPKNQEPYLAAAGGSSDQPVTDCEPSNPGAAMSLEDQVEALPPAPRADSGSQAMKRQRGDDSLLFSFEKMQSNIRSSDKQHAGGTGPREESSGLIDMRDLARRAASTTPLPVESIVPMFTPSMVAPVVLTPVRPSGPPAWLRILIVGSVLVLGSALAVLAVYLYRSSGGRTTVPAPVAAGPAVRAVAPAAPAAMVPGPSAPAPGTSGPVTAAPAVAKVTPPVVTRSAPSTRHHGSTAPTGAPVVKHNEPAPPPPSRSRSNSHRTSGSGGVDLESLLNSSSGSELSRPARGVAVNTAGALPEHLTRNEIVAGMRTVQQRVSACFSQYHVPGTALVSLRIVPSGKVQSADVVGSLAHTPSGDCVARAARAASFAQFSGPAMSLQYPFALH